MIWEIYSCIIIVDHFRLECWNKYYVRLSSAGTDLHKLVSIKGHFLIYVPLDNLERCYHDDYILFWVCHFEDKRALKFVIRLKFLRQFTKWKTWDLQRICVPQPWLSREKEKFFAKTIWNTSRHNRKERA